MLEMGFIFPQALAVWGWPLTDDVKPLETANRVCPGCIPGPWEPSVKTLNFRKLMKVAKE
jgi:hypothetical protein